MRHAETLHHVLCFKDAGEEGFLPQTSFHCTSMVLVGVYVAQTAKNHSVKSKRSLDIILYRFDQLTVVMFRLSGDGNSWS